MNRFAVALGVALAVTAVSAAPATAQTRVGVMLGFALPRPYVSGVIVVGPPDGYDDQSDVIVVRAPRRYRYRHLRGWERREYRGDHAYSGDREYRGDRDEYRGDRHHRGHGDDGENDNERGDE